MTKEKQVPASDRMVTTRHNGGPPIYSPLASCEYGEQVVTNLRNRIAELEDEVRLIYPESEILPENRKER